MDIKFDYVESLVVLPGQIDHVAMGNTAEVCILKGAPNCLLYTSDAADE